VHSPLELRAQGSTVVPQPAAGLVKSAERLWDALALLMILSGTTLFLLARSGLTSIAAGTHVLPPGVSSFVQRVDYFSAQSSLGLGMAGVGLAIGLGSSFRHAMRRRTEAARAARGTAIGAPVTPTA